MKTQAFLGSLAILAMASCFSCYCMGAPVKRPNIILFVTDDMGADAGCYGNAVIKTPHLDALAKDGIRLTSAFCTTASCSASRSVILTGLFNHANAHYGHAHG